MKVIVTGGAGFIGSHIVLELVAAGHDVFVIDNLANSFVQAFNRLETISGQPIAHVIEDLKDTQAVKQIFSKFQPDAIIHLAGLKAVGESVSFPLKYYEENIGNTLSLLNVMQETGCENLIFSSSATVYGTPEYLPIDEKHSCGPFNPYGRTKYFIEGIISDWAYANTKASVTSLRYFNPIGAHESGLIGEDYSETPNNIMPILMEAAAGQRKGLSVFGTDYDTPDGTAIRDYIHVSDLASAHVSALKFVDENTGYDVFNIGTGSGSSVLELIKTFETSTGVKVPHTFTDRREGDVGECWADSSRANAILGWFPKYTLEQMCKSAWRWKSENPAGYR